MIALDMQSVMLSRLSTDIICTVLAAILWHQTRTRFSGVGYWALGFIFQTVGLILIMLRGTIPDWISMVVSNTLNITAAFLILVGLEHFTGHVRRNLHNYLIIAVFTGIQTYFAVIQPSLWLRGLNITITLVLILVQCLWLIFHRLEASMRSVMKIVGIAYGLYTIVFFFRAIMLILKPISANDYFRVGGGEAAYFIVYQVLLIVAISSLSFAVNRRLVLEREKAMSEVKILSGLLPICVSCKKIRDDKGYWNQIETYIAHRARVDFSHGLCPECAAALYPEFEKPSSSTKKAHPH